MNYQCTNKSIRVIAPSLLRNISILHQNKDIGTQEKDRLTKLLQDSLASGDTSALNKAFSNILVGSLFPEIIEECILLTSN